MQEDTSNYEIYHYGILRKSGRYPWGSGKNPFQRSKDFYAYYDDLKAQGISQRDIAAGLGFLDRDGNPSTTKLRDALSIAKAKKRQGDIASVYRMKEASMSNVAIASELGISEGLVRSYLKTSDTENLHILENTAEALRQQVAEKGYIDVGAGTEIMMGISDTRLRAAIAILQDEGDLPDDGYTIHYIKETQLGTGKETTIKVLAAPGVEYTEVSQNRDKIRLVDDYTEDGGRSYLGIETPKSVDLSRVEINYGPEGGADADGTIYLRPGVDDISLGNAKYAQVRIAVDGTHYLKGMAVYKDDLPDGVDIMFNTDKKRTNNKLDAMKTMKETEAGDIDPDNPFGAIIRQKHYIDSDGNRQLSALNIVGTKDPNGETFAGEEGGWSTWSKNLSSQMLSKQPVSLAKQQLDLTYAIKQQEFDDIMAYNNPVVRKKLLESFADDMDSSAVHLKAAALPRQQTHVILPINTLKDNEVYAPNYKNGENVALVRYPHGGIFEIPELRVNNRNPEGKNVLGGAIDAIGINSKVASRLSGADFDGDTVLVIPNNNKRVKSSSPLDGLKDFDPKTAYPGYEGMKPLSARGKQQKMGDVTNLVTDMTIKGATNSEIARAVRHTMVVIDAEKHKLNHAQSYIDNGIAELKSKYQEGVKSGASTLISRASSQKSVLDRIPRRARDGGPVDKETGKRVWTETGKSWIDEKTGKVKYKTNKSTKMYETEDAFTLSSGTPIETVYASHANRLKSLANRARKESIGVVDPVYSKSAAKTYATETSSLKSKLQRAKENAPRERQAQLFANAVVKAKTRDNPSMDSAEKKKVKTQALNEARIRTGAKKERIDITPKEWEAIQAGAISKSMLSQIVTHTDLDLIKQYATPRDRPVMTDAKMARAKAMQGSGYTQAEIADALGVPTSTLNDALLSG